MSIKLRSVLLYCASFIICALSAYHVLALATQKDQSSLPLDKQQISHYFYRFEYLKEKEAWDEIVLLGEKALFVACQLGESESEIKIRNQLASTYFYQGQYSHAYEHVNLCLEKSRHTNNGRGIICALYQLSALHRAFAEQEDNPTKSRALFELAKQYAKDSLAYFEETFSPDIHLKAKALLNLGSAEMEDIYNGDLAVAEKAYEEALRLFARINCQDDFQRVVIRLGKLLLSKGELQKSKDLVCNLHSSIQKQRILVHYEHLLALIEKKEGNIQAAQEYASSAKRRAEKLGAKYDQVNLATFLASLSLE